MVVDALVSAVGSVGAVVGSDAVDKGPEIVYEL